MIKYIFPFLIIFCFWGNLSAQDSLAITIDSIPNPTKKITKKKKQKGLKNYLKKDYPSPKKAVTLAIIPGMGQIYNKKFWKLPLVYGALGGVIYAIDYNTKNYKIFQSQIDGTYSGPLDLSSLSAAALQARRNNFDKNRQLSWIGLIGFYLISAGDALVDAHLKDFSVDDDISFVPILESNYNNQPIMGIGLRINLSK